MFRIFLGLTALLSLLLLHPVSAAAVTTGSDSFLVVVHPQNPVDFLTRSQVSDIFLGKIDAWDHGGEIDLVVPDNRSDLSCAFAEAIHDRSIDSVQRYWTRQVTSGRLQPPEQKETEAEVLARVASSTSAVGYVSTAADVSSVKVLGVVSEPLLLADATPEYTNTARRARVQGLVVLEVRVDETGRVADVEPVKMLPHGLTQQAMRAVKRFRYEPAKHRGEPVPATVEVSIRFRL